MLKVCLIALSVPVISSAATWKGLISDSACGASHAKMMKEHKDLKTNKECTQACIRAGSQYVFVTNGKVYKLQNQNMPELLQNAGQNVTVTGDLKGDTITAATITGSAKAKK